MIFIQKQKHHKIFYIQNDFSCKIKGFKCKFVIKRKLACKFHCSFDTSEKWQIKPALNSIIKKISDTRMKAHKISQSCIFLPPVIKAVNCRLPCNVRRSYSMILCVPVANLAFIMQLLVLGLPSILVQAALYFLVLINTRLVQQQMKCNNVILLVFLLEFCKRLDSNCSSLYLSSMSTKSQAFVCNSY